LHEEELIFHLLKKVAGCKKLLMHISLEKTECTEIYFLFFLSYLSRKKRKERL